MDISYIDLISGRIKDEFENDFSYNETLSKTQLVNEFEKSWNNYERDLVNEFLQVNDAVNREWKEYKRKNYPNYLIRNVENDISNYSKMTDMWSAFKRFWELNTMESNLMFEEINYINMSDGMLREWRIKYNFKYPYVYELDNRAKYGNIINENYLSKTKFQLWNDFREIWNIDLQNYTEYKFTKMCKFINDIYINDEDYKFFHYCQKNNYHNFEIFSILQQYEICKDYANEHIKYESSISSEDEFADFIC
jgi:hypothetical protein